MKEEKSRKGTHRRRTREIYLVGLVSDARRMAGKGVAERKDFRR